MTAYSLGARTMLQAIRSLDQAFKLKTLTVMAAAIDDTCLVKEYQDAAKQMGKISVMASSCDDVLKWAFPAGNLASGMVARGDPYSPGALGRYGPNPANQPANLWQTPNLPELWTFGHPSYINSDGAVAGPLPFPVPLTVPPQGTYPPSAPNWQQACAAGFVSTRLA
jgi:hypothetical protein